MYKHTRTRKGWKIESPTIPNLHTNYHLKKYRPKSRSSYRMQAVSMNSENNQSFVFQDRFRSCMIVHVNYLLQPFWRRLGNRSTHRAATEQALYRSASLRKSSSCSLVKLPIPQSQILPQEQLPVIDRVNPLLTLKVQNSFKQTPLRIWNSYHFLTLKLRKLLNSTTYLGKQEHCRIIKSLISI